MATLLPPRSVHAVQRVPLVEPLSRPFVALSVMQRSEVSVAAQAGARAAPVASLVQLPHVEASRRSCRFLLASTAKQSVPPAKATHSGRAASDPPAFCQAAHFLPSKGSAVQRLVGAPGEAVERRA